MGRYCQHQQSANRRREAEHWVTSPRLLHAFDLFYKINYYNHKKFEINQNIKLCFSSLSKRVEDKKLLSFSIICSLKNINEKIIDIKLWSSNLQDFQRFHINIQKNFHRMNTQPKVQGCWYVVRWGDLFLLLHGQNNFFWGLKPFRWAKKLQNWKETYCFYHPWWQNFWPCNAIIIDQAHKDWRN